MSEAALAERFRLSASSDGILSSMGVGAVVSAATACAALCFFRLMTCCADRA